MVTIVRIIYSIDRRYKALTISRVFTVFVNLSASFSENFPSTQVTITIAAAATRRNNYRHRARRLFTNYANSRPDQWPSERPLSGWISGVYSSRLLHPWMPPEIPDSLAHSRRSLLCPRVEMKFASRDKTWLFTTFPRVHVPRREFRYPDVLTEPQRKRECRRHFHKKRQRLSFSKENTSIERKWSKVENMTARATQYFACRGTHQFDWYQWLRNFQKVNLTCDWNAWLRHTDYCFLSKYVCAGIWTKYSDVSLITWNISNYLKQHTRLYIVLRTRISDIILIHYFALFFFELCCYVNACSNKLLKQLFKYVKYPPGTVFHYFIIYLKILCNLKIAIFSKRDRIDNCFLKNLVKNWVYNDQRSYNICF